MVVGAESYGYGQRTLAEKDAQDVPAFFVY